jgi:DNA-binding IclR family transcriptional regulator
MLELGIALVKDDGTCRESLNLTTKNDLPLERYFRILETIAISGESLGVSDISERCDLPVATAHRLLQNLQSADLLASAGGKRKDYQLGQRLLRLLHAGSDAVWLAISVQPVLDKLTKEFGDTCYLARLMGHEVISVAWAVPNEGLRANVIPGYTLAPHVAASAKAIMAFQEQELIDRALAAPLPKLTPETKIARKEIDKDYAAVRKNGFATCWNEMELGMGAIAIPIPLPDIGIIYSLGTAGLIDRLTRRPLTNSLEVLRSAVGPLVKALGDRRPADRIGVQRGRPKQRQKPAASQIFAK